MNETRTRGKKMLIKLIRKSCTRGVIIRGLVVYSKIQEKQIKHHIKPYLNLRYTTTLSNSHITTTMSTSSNTHGTVKQEAAFTTQLSCKNMGLLELQNMTLSKPCFKHKLQSTNYFMSKRVKTHLN